MASMLNELIKRETKGVSGSLPYDPVQYCILAAGTAIAWAYTIELDLVIFYTFRRRKGLYFWALLICSWGCSLHALGFILKFLVGSSWLLNLPFIEIGWVAMVTGQAFVLYSRLHLVVRNQQTLRYMLAMIIINAFALHVPMIVFTYGSNSPNYDFWTHKFNIMERIQLVGFCLQETVISTVYITSTVRLLGSIYHSMTRKVMLQLLLINCICIGMDVILIGLEFTGNYVAEASIKPMFYAIKLKLEFAVLNQLMGLTKAGFTEENQWRGGQEQAAGHELHNRTLATKTDPEANPAPDRKVGNWQTASKGLRGSFSGARMSITHPEQIFQTQHVDIVSEPAAKDASNTSSSTAVTAETMMHQPAPKVKSLMGTPIVHMPGRNRGEVGRDSVREGWDGGRLRGRLGEPEGRAHSPTESEKEIFRKSTDSEKEGTRWIEGDDRL